MEVIRGAMKQVLFLALDALGINAAFRYLNRGKIKVLLYHSVCDETGAYPNAIRTDEFERQLQHVLRHYHPVSLSADGEWRDLRPDRVNVLFTFDDGFENNQKNAWTTLKARGIPACFFLITDCAAGGSPPGFASRYGGPVDAYRTIPASGAREMSAQGATIGSHGTDHRDYSAFEVEDALADARASKTALQAVLGTPPELFALPWGKHRADQLEPLSGIYRRIFTVEHGFNTSEDRLLRRNEVTGTLQMRAAASGALDAVSRLIGRSRPTDQRIR
jgi:peptidoglycan/xylan/chitin deacetylase (PgdA/CDA1 family)